MSDTPTKYVTYAHREDPTGYRCVDLATSTPPKWAVDVQPFDELNASTCSEANGIVAVNDGVSITAPVRVTFDNIAEVCNKKLGSLNFDGYGQIHLDKDELVAIVNEFAVITESHTTSLERIAKLQREVEEFQLEAGVKRRCNDVVSTIPFQPDDGFPLCDGYMVGKDDGKSTLYPTVDEAIIAYVESNPDLLNAILKKHST
jgi:hypothetical protein